MKNLLLFGLLLSIQTLALDFPSFPRLPVEEHLLGVTRAEFGVNFQVHSGGCTCKDDFDFKVELGAGNSLYLIDMIRHTEDNCKAFFPLGETIFVSFDELNIPPGSSYQIINPIMGRS